MNRQIAWIGVISFAFGCADIEPQAAGEASVADESPASVEQELTGWLGPISEESAYNNKDCSQADIGVTASYCSGSYCDNNWLRCAHLPTGVQSSLGTVTGRWVSEEQPTYYDFCVDSNGYLNGIVTGLSGSGSYSDNLMLHCGTVSFSSGHWWGSCQWTGWFSEEGGGYNYFPSGKFAAGIACSGSYCDRVAYYVCSFT